MATFRAMRNNGEVFLFESSSLEQAKADAWDSFVEEVTDAEIAKMEKAAAKEAKEAPDDTEGAPS